MKRIWQILNILSIIFAVVMNYIVGARIIDVPSIGAVSDKYATLLTPATYAFSIWSLIYFLLIVLALYQARDLFSPSKSNDLPERMGPYFVLANIGNALWTYIFVSELIGLSVLILVSMMASLFALIYRLNIAMYDAPAKTIAFVWWPLMLYTGWVLVASVVNVASWFDSVGVTVSVALAAVTLVVLCNALLILLFTRNVRELVLASTWGIIAVAVQLFLSGADLIIVTTACTVSSVLLICITAHAFINRHATILAKLL